MPPTDQWLSKKEFAQHRGKSPATITKYLKAGKLKGATKIIGGKELIDWKKADQLLEERLDPIQTKAQGKKKKNPAEQDEKRKTIGKANLDENTTFSEAQRLDKLYAASLKKLEYEQKTGKLIDAEEAGKVFEKIVSNSKVRILAVKSKIAPILKDAIPDPDLFGSVLEKIDELHLEACGELSQSEL